MEIGDITNFFLQLEGPYKWYVLAGVIVVITGLVTRFIFKTLKWFVIITAVILIFLAVFKLVTDFL